MNKINGWLSSVVSSLFRKTMHSYNYIRKGKYINGLKLVKLWPLSLVFTKVQRNVDRGLRIIWIHRLIGQNGLLKNKIY